MQIGPAADQKARRHIFGALLLILLKLPLAAESPPSVTASTQAPSTAPSETAVPSEPWSVEKVEWKGLINVRESVVQKHIRASPGVLYDSSGISSDVQSLLNLGYFEHVQVDVLPLAPASTGPVLPPPVILSYQVRERPWIAEIRWKGNRSLSTSKLAETLRLKSNDPLEEFKLKEDLEKIRRLYREKGYAHATIEVERAAPKDKENRLSLTFSIQEGKKVTVKKVALHGVSAFREKRLIKKMENRPGKVFQDERLSKDLEKLEKYYKDRGYLLYAASAPVVTAQEEESKIFLDLFIQEGPKLRFGSFSFSGNFVYESEALRKVTRIRPGKIYNQEKVDETIQEIQQLYADLGHLRAQILPQPQIQSETGVVEMHFKIEEGPVIRVGAVDVEGNTYTKDYVLLREIVIREGEIFSAKKIRKSQERIFNLGFLDDIRVDLQNTEDPQTVDLLFDVKEGRPGIFSAGAGFSSVDGLVGTLQVQHMNLLGRAHRLNFLWEFGGRVQNFDIGWTNPWLLNKPISYGFSVFNTRRRRQFSTESTGFKEKRTGGSVQLGPRFADDKYRLNLTYTYQTVEIFDVLDKFKSSIREGTDTSSILSTEFTRDTRDNFFDPTHGNKNTASVRLAGGPLGGTIRFYNPGYSTGWFWHLLSAGDYPLVFSLGSRGGFIEEFGSSSDVPVFEKFFIGGPDSIRGYDIRGDIGPAEGGKVFSIFNAELKFPLVREAKRTILQLVGFFDAGSAWRNFQELSFEMGSQERQLKAGTGIEIRFKTPVFPIRLGWGYGLHHKPGRDKTEIYFTIGNLF
ncbi:MAG: outer membrane protein assembly factor BamA [Elusimicrobia bacterium]|nr:outer membrane protein assembly factor BamA [Elusimicrobiota bacterium]